MKEVRLSQSTNIILKLLQDLFPYPDITEIALNPFPLPGERLRTSEQAGPLVESKTVHALHNSLTHSK